MSAEKALHRFWDLYGVMKNRLKSNERTTSGSEAMRRRERLYSIGILNKLTKKMKLKGETR